MKNPKLELTVITKPAGSIATYYENRVLDESKVSTNWNSFKIDLKNCKQTYESKEVAPLLIPVSWKKDGFDTVKNEDGKAILINGKTIPRRCGDNIDSWFMLPIDIDDYITIEKAKKLYGEYEYIGYTTFNHTLKINKYRLLFPLARPIKHADFLKKKIAISEFIGLADPVSMSSAQGFYLPSCHSENKDMSTVWPNKGKLIDLNLFENDKNVESKSDEFIGKDWYLNEEPDILNIGNASDYLYEFISRNLLKSGDHKDCMRLHSILKSFEVDESTHIKIVSTFKSFSSQHNIKNGYKSSDIKYGGIGSLINLLKDFGVKDKFNVYKFKVLAGMYKQKIIRKVLKSNIPVTEEYFKLDGKIFSSIESEENNLVYINEKRKNMVGDVISDSSFPTGISILNSPTNTGKTFLFKHVLKNPRILIAPTKALVDQIASGDNSIEKCYDKMPFPVGSKVIVMTYDKVKSYMNAVKIGKVDKQDYDLYVDEAHNLYSSFNFRSRTMETVYKSICELYFNKVVLMSGTMRDEFLPNLKVDKKITIEKGDSMQQKCSIIKTNSWVKHIKDSMNKDSLTLILLNNKNKGKELSSLLERDGYNAQLFNADNQKDVINQDMLNNEVVSSDVNALIFTSIGVEGLNIKNHKINKVFAVGNHPSSVLEQLKNRARIAKPELVVLKTINSHDDGYVRWIDVDKRIASAKKYVDFANIELMSAPEEQQNKLSKYLLTTIKSMPSDLKYTVGFDYEEKRFFVSRLGLAAYLYEIDCSNEEHNSELFELHMKNYNYIVSNCVVELPDNETKYLEKEVKIIKEEERNRLVKCYRDIMDIKLNDTEKLNFTALVINNNGKHPEENYKVEGIEEFESISDLIIKSSILSKYYSYEDVKDIIVDYIRGKNVYDTAKGYGEQIKNEAWIRPKLENEFKEGSRYTIHEVREKLKSIEKLAKDEVSADFDGISSDKAISSYIHSMFSIDKKRVMDNGKKVTVYLVNSYNPVGKEVVIEKYVINDKQVITQTSLEVPINLYDDYQILKTASL